MNAELMSLTQSRRRAFRTCRRLHHIEYDEGWEPTRKGDALRCGTLYHDAVSRFWTMVQEYSHPKPEADKHEVLEDMARAAAAAMARQIQPDQWDDVAMDACALAERYHLLWPDAFEFDVLEIEREVSSTLLNPDTGKASQTWALTGTVDLILRHRVSAEVFLVEHKTTSDSILDDAADYWRKLEMDTQLTQYVVLAQALGHTITRVIYDVARKPQTQLLKATPIEKRQYTKAGALYASQRGSDETLNEYRARVAEQIDENPGKFLRRRTVARTEGQLVDGMRDCWEDAKMIREAQINGWHTRNPDACHQYGVCPYWDHCAMGVPLEGSSLWRKKGGVA